MKIKRIILSITVMIISLMVASCEPLLNKKNLHEDYPSLDEKNIIKVLEIKEVLKKIDEKESFALMMGFPACPWCQAVIPYYNEVATSLKLRDVNYLDILDMREETSADHEDYLKLKEYCKEALDKEKDRINAPTIIVVNKGHLTSYHLDTVEGHVKNEAGILPPLNEDQITELKFILNILLKDLA